MSVLNFLRHIVSVFPFSVVVLFCLALTAHSATFVVNKVADTNDGVCDNDCSLREAIVVANSLPTTDKINFDPSVFDTPRVITLTGGSLVVSNNGGLWINGPGPDLLGISGNNQTRVIVNIDGGTVAIFGVTIRDGNGVNIGAGGGIANSGSLTLHNSVIRNNFGNTFGGGIYNGGAMQLTNCVVIDNNGDLYGGGIYNFNSPAVLTVYNSTISDNVARRDGGGIYNNGSVTITNSTISNNIASSVNDGGNGGGLFTTGYVNRNSSVTVTNSTIADNVSLAGGGGIMSDGSVVNLTNVTIKGNSVTNTNPYYYGGGVVNFQVNYPGIVRAKNTIIADNTSANGQAPDFGGVLTSQGFNLVENTHWTSFPAPPQNDIFGQDPRLGPLTFNGGTTKTCGLLPGSPAIDVIPSVFPLTDQRFYARPVDGDANGILMGDIGAFEANSAQASSLVQIQGRVSLANNRAAFPAQVRISDGEGSVRFAPVNPLGYYRFRDVSSGKAYILDVISKRQSYMPRVLFAMEEMLDVNFVP